MTLELNFDLRAELLQDRDERVFDEVEGRRFFVVRAALEAERADSRREQERRQDRLKDERRACLLYTSPSPRDS